MNPTPPKNTTAPAADEYATTSVVENGCVGAGVVGGVGDGVGSGVGDTDGEPVGDTVGPVVDSYSRPVCVYGRCAHMYFHVFHSDTEF